MKNQKKCVICGNMFYSPPSDKTVTCSPACRAERTRLQHQGKKHTEETKLLMSQKAAGRDMGELQKIATAAAKESPKSGRFVTNINAKDWHLISPDGKHYEFHSLMLWLRENCRELFGCEPDSKEFNNVRSGLAGAKRATQGKKYPSATYKGWQVIPTKDDESEG